MAPINDSPKPPLQRVTMTFPVVNSARCVAFVSTGGSKAPVLKVTFQNPNPQIPLSFKTDLIQHFNWTVVIICRTKQFR